TVRAFLMTSITLIAVALNRSAITRRNLALAAGILLIITPEALVGPSFQMSFAAVAMLVAWHDRPRRTRPRPSNLAFERLLRLCARSLSPLAVATLVASLATAPFAAYHFHRVTLQSLAANLMATPIVSALIMPLALLALAAEPFGLGTPVWQAIGVA